MTLTNTTALPADDPYDALTLALERADALNGLLEARLSDLSEQPDAPSELYALSVVARSLSDHLQIILDNALSLRARMEHAAAPASPTNRQTAITPGQLAPIDRAGPSTRSSREKRGAR